MFSQAIIFLALERGKELIRLKLMNLINIDEFSR